MLADREYLARCNSRWPRHSKLEVTRSERLIIQQQAPVLHHGDPHCSLSLTHTHTHICAHLTQTKMCLCSHGCTGSRGWCIAACKAELSVSFNSLSQRSNRTYSRARRLRPLTASATLYKTNSRLHERRLSQAQKNNRERQLWSTLTDSRTQDALACASTQIWELKLSFSQNHELIHNPRTTLTPAEPHSVGACPKPAINPKLRTHVPYWVEVEQHLFTAWPASVCLRFWFAEIAVITALLRRTNRWTIAGSWKPHLDCTVLSYTQDSEDMDNNISQKSLSIINLYSQSAGFKPHWTVDQRRKGKVILVKKICMVKDCREYWWISQMKSWNLITAQRTQCLNGITVTVQSFHNYIQ